jgi:dihydrofolate reductase
MRRFIATMQTSIDAKIEGPDGYADWVNAWYDVAEVMPAVDGCLLGGGMYPDYEAYWSAMAADPTQPLPTTGRLPTAAELEYARFATHTPHHVLSTSLPSAAWAHTRLLRSVDEVRALKRQPGRAIYVVGGARTLASLIDLGLIDELRLTVHPLVAGQGKSLFETIGRRHWLQLRRSVALPDGRLSHVYALEPGVALAA